jgi:hypothetical protein
MKDRYGEANGSPPDVNNDGIRTSGRNVASKSANTTDEDADQPRMRDNSYYECANERLYEAYNELHLLAQGDSSQTSAQSKAS